MTEERCTECGHPEIDSRGLCGRCYRRLRKRLIRAGTFVKLDTKRPLIDRLMEKGIAGPSGCIVFTGSTNSKGYGTISGGAEGSRHLYAHRAAYELFTGPIPEGLLVDHQCHNRDANCPGGKCLHRRCINPHHLELATPRENQHRSQVTFAGRTHCSKGHPFTPENTYIRPDNGGRQCKTCSWLRRRGGDFAPCGHVSLAGNSCLRPQGHAGAHNSKKRYPPSAWVDLAAGAA